MMEAEWLACADPARMLEFLRRKASDRKLRLFVCACARQLWHRTACEKVYGPPDDRSRNAVELAEAFIDGRVSEADLRMAREPARAASEAAYWSVGYPVGPEAFPVIAAAAHAEAAMAGAVADELTDDRLYCGIDGLGKSGPEVAILHCLFNPFRPVAVDPVWITADVAALAEAAYQERGLPSGHLDPDRLAVLADALEEAGADADLLAHLRDPGPHVRGCWAVDLLTGRG